MTFSAFIVFLASAGALGGIASVALQIVKAVFPAVQDKSAKIASVIVATLVAIGATLALPFLGQMPPAVEQFFPLVCWLASQIWFEIIKPKV